MKEHLCKKPFLKWAGGKTSILKIIDSMLPQQFKQFGNFVYVEPFVGGGSVFIYLKGLYDIDSFYLSDINRALIFCYLQIQNNHEHLINELQLLKDEYLNKEMMEEKEACFQEHKKIFNYLNKMETLTAHEAIIYCANFIFLNKTCFNGMYRENRTGDFNTSFGKRDSPSIFNPQNINYLHNLFQGGVFFSNYTWEHSLHNIPALAKDKNIFLYLDPPYRPITKTSNFTEYNKSGFNDFDHIQLIKKLIELDNKLNTESQQKFFFMLSNSFSQDQFFQQQCPQFKFSFIDVQRNISGNTESRKKIKELIITNY